MDKDKAGLIGAEEKQITGNDPGGGNDLDEGEIISWNEFTQNTTFHGVRYIFDEKPFGLRRAAWFTSVIVALALFAGWTSIRVIAYAAYESNVNVAIRYPETMKFPAITICNQNNYRLSKAMEWKMYDYIDRFFKEPDGNFSLFGNMTHIDTKSFHVDAAHSLNDLIDSCKWNRDDCPPGAFQMRLTDLGVCYTFNDDVFNPVEINVPGSGYGLHLVLNVEQYEYMRGRQDDIGVKILLHNSTEPPRIRDQGYVLETGKHFLLGIKRKEIEDLEYPYGSCNKTAKPKASCELDCETRYIRNKCNCTDIYMNGTDICPVKKEFQCATREWMGGFNGTVSKCKCTVPCERTVYEAHISAALLSKYNMDRVALTDSDKKKITEKRFLEARDLSQRATDSIREKDYAEIEAVLNASDVLLNTLNKYCRLFQDLAESPYFSGMPNIFDMSNRDKLADTNTIEKELLPERTEFYKLVEDPPKLSDLFSILEQIREYVAKDIVNNVESCMNDLDLPDESQNITLKDLCYNVSEGSFSKGDFFRDDYDEYQSYERDAETLTSTDAEIQSYSEEVELNALKKFSKVSKSDEISQEYETKANTPKTNRWKWKKGETSAVTKDASKNITRYEPENNNFIPHITHSFNFLSLIDWFRGKSVRTHGHDNTRSSFAPDVEYKRQLGPNHPPPPPPSPPPPPYRPPPQLQPHNPYQYAESPPPYSDHQYYSGGIMDYYGSSDQYYASPPFSDSSSLYSGSYSYAFYDYSPQGPCYAYNPNWFSSSPYYGSYISSSYSSYSSYPSYGSYSSSYPFYSSSSFSSYPSYSSSSSSSYPSYSSSSFSSYPSYSSSSFSSYPSYSSSSFSSYPSYSSSSFSSYPSYSSSSYSHSSSSSPSSSSSISNVNDIYSSTETTTNAAHQTTQASDSSSSTVSYNPTSSPPTETTPTTTTTTVADPDSTVTTTTVNPTPGPQDTTTCPSFSIPTNEPPIVAEIDPSCITVYTSNSRYNLAYYNTENINEDYDYEYHDYDYDNDDECMEDDHCDEAPGGSGTDESETDESPPDDLSWANESDDPAESPLVTPKPDYSNKCEGIKSLICEIIKALDSLFADGMYEKVIGFKKWYKETLNNIYWSKFSTKDITDYVLHKNCLSELDNFDVAKPFFNMIHKRLKSIETMTNPLDLARKLSTLSQLIEKSQESYQIIGKIELSRCMWFKKYWQVTTSKPDSQAESDVAWTLHKIDLAKNQLPSSQMIQATYGELLRAAKTLNQTKKSYFKYLYRYKAERFNKRQLYAKYSAVGVEKALTNIYSHVEDAKATVRTVGSDLDSVKKQLQTSYLSLVNLAVPILTMENLESLSLLKAARNATSTDVAETLAGIEMNLKTKLPKLLDDLLKPILQTLDEAKTVLPDTYSKLSDAAREIEKNLEEFNRGNKMDTQFYMENFIRVDLYYPELSTETVVQQEAFTWVSLLSEVGGFMGLLLGASILTVCEVVDYIVLLCMDSCKTRKGKNP